jgi:hypothetical protein
MLSTLNDRRNWSRRGLSILAASFTAAIVLSLLDGIMRGPVAMSVRGGHGSIEMFLSWCYNFRIMADDLMYVGALIFVGGKFFETRTIFTVGFDKTDAARIVMKGPSDDNIVWIGHKYGSRLEAESVAAMIESRLKSDAL